MDNVNENRPVVVVTGSSGLIGSRLITRLAASHDVIGLDVKEPEAGSPAKEFIACDLTDDESVRQAISRLRGERLASVVHLAAYYDFSGEPSPLYNDLTVEGTRRLLRALKAEGMQVEQFIFSSSLLMMKPAAESERLTEDSATQAEWAYPRSKLDAERGIAEEHGATPAVVLRIAGVYDDMGHSLPITQQISRIYEKKLESYFFPGDAEHGQSFLHLDDLTDCFELAIERRHDLAPHEVFLIGEEDVMSYGELQEAVGELIHGKQWPTIRLPKLVAKAGAWVQGRLASEGDEPFIQPWMVDLADAHYPIDNTRARERLGWRPKHTLRETLPAIIASLERNPRRWYEVNHLSPPDHLPRGESAADGEKHLFARE